MHPMIGKQFQLMFPDGLRTYKIINVDVSEGWIKLQREGVQGHFYLHESIHKHFLRKIGYRRLNESR
jgi:hypothetical protein